MLQTNGSYLKVCALVLVSSQGFQVFMRISFVEFQRVTLNHYFTQSNFGTKGAKCVGKSELHVGFITWEHQVWDVFQNFFNQVSSVIHVYLMHLSWHSSIPVCLFWLFIFDVYLDNLLFLCVYFDCLSSMFI